MKQGLLAGAMCLLAASFAFADDWPQFRGPNRDGVSKEKGLLKAWPKDGPKLLWTYQDAGLGHSSFAIIKGVLYTLGTDFDFKNQNTGAKDEYVIAINVADGKEIWRVKIAPIYTYKGNSYGDGPRSTPTIDGNLLYALGGQGELVCLDINAKGKEVWRKNLLKDLNGVVMTTYGVSEAVLIDGDHVICTPGGKDGTLAALNKKTGALVWRSKDWTEKAPYSSMIAADIQGVRQYVQLGYIGGAGGGSVAGIDAKSGKLLWKKQAYAGDNEGASTSPIVKDNHVHTTVGFGGGCHLFEIDKKQEATEKYSKKNQKLLKNTHGGVVLVNGHVYGHSEPSGWICQEFKSGDVKWFHRDELKCQSGAIIAADDLLYLYTDEGEVGLVKPDPDKEFDVVSTFTIPKKSTIPAPGNRTTSRQSRIWAHPVIANGVLYLRDHEYIFAFDISAGKPKAENRAPSTEYAVFSTQPSLMQRIFSGRRCSSPAFVSR